VLEDPDDARKLRTGMTFTIPHVVLQEDPDDAKKLRTGMKFTNPRERLDYFAKALATRRVCVHTGAPQPMYKVEVQKIMKEFAKAKGDVEVNISESKQVRGAVMWVPMPMPNIFCPHCQPHFAPLHHQRKIRVVLQVSWGHSSAFAACSLNSGS
jgi:hypothetical protein